MELLVARASKGAYEEEPLYINTLEELFSFVINSGYDVVVGYGYDSDAEEFVKEITILDDNYYYPQQYFDKQNKKML